MPRQALKSAEPSPALDLAHVKGQEAAKRALEVAAAGGHPVLLIGAEGSGKTLLGRCLPGLLPPPTGEETAEIASRYQGAGLDPPPGRPFRAPHRTTRPADLVGRGREPGEVELARGGVLFLDDLPRFGRRSLRALSEPLKGNRGPSLGRECAQAAGFLLAAAMRPCPCGRLHHPPDFPGGHCSCPPWKVDRYSEAVRELFLDLVHLHVEVPAIGLSELRSRCGETTRQVGQRVARARHRQRDRPEQGTLNATLRPWALPKWCRPDDAGRRLLDLAYERLGLTVREVGVILRVARTIADLSGSEAVRAPHVAEAVQYRSLARRRQRTQGVEP
ncbi:MAG TPA: ATP-binding protein [Thermoanaerobaculia bacterium]|nr:ATP-binding protein [Thermoanaerobaculia bacterium]